MDAFALCLSQNSVFAGSLDKLVLTRPLGYLHSIAEMKSIMDIDAKGAEHVGMPNNKMSYPSKKMQKAYELPRLPPWFVYVGSEKLYEALAGVLRLVGLALFAGCLCSFWNFFVFDVSLCNRNWNFVTSLFLLDSRSEGSLSVIVDIPLGYLRKLILEIRAKEHSLESWESWYDRTGSGQLVRQASTAACILNEMIFGLSDQAISTFARMFQNANLKEQGIEGFNAIVDNQSGKLQETMADKIFLRGCRETGLRNELIDCIGSILHEYLSPEVWTLPVEHTDSVLQSNRGGAALSLHFFRDTAMLYQEIYTFLNLWWFLFLFLFGCLLVGGVGGGGGV